MPKDYKLPSFLVVDLKNRLKTLSGQVNGIIKMLETGKDPQQISIQFKSLDKGMQKAHYVLLDEVYRKALAMGIVKAVDACPGDCGQEEKIDFLKSEFPNFGLGEVAKYLKEIQSIEERLSQLNDNI